MEKYFEYKLKFSSLFVKIAYGRSLYLWRNYGIGRKFSTRRVQNLRQYLQNTYIKLPSQGHRLLKMRSIDLPLTHQETKQKGLVRNNTIVPKKDPRKTLGLDKPTKGHPSADDRRRDIRRIQPIRATRGNPADPLICIQVFLISHDLIF